MTPQDLLERETTPCPYYCLFNNYYVSSNTVNACEVLQVSPLLSSYPLTLFIIIIIIIKGFKQKKDRFKKCRFYSSTSNSIERFLQINRVLVPVIAIIHRQSYFRVNRKVNEPSSRSSFPFTFFLPFRIIYLFIFFFLLIKFIFQTYLLSHFKNCNSFFILLPRMNRLTSFKAQFHFTRI